MVIYNHLQRETFVAIITMIVTIHIYQKSFSTDITKLQNLLERIRHAYLELLSMKNIQALTKGMSITS